MYHQYPYFRHEKILIMSQPKTKSITRGLSHHHFSRLMPFVTEDFSTQSPPQKKKTENLSFLSKLLARKSQFLKATKF